MTKDLSPPELFDSLLFELNKAMTGIPLSVPQGVYRSLDATRMWLTHLHERNIKLEERVAKLEQQLTPHVTIGPSVKDLMQIDEQLRKANAEKINAIVQESFRQGAIRPTTLDKLKLQAETTKVGYVPDDLRS